MSLRIFIVDDEAPARTRLKMLLMDIAPECPHEFLGEADNGPEALERIGTLLPDVVLLDVQMPGMTGIELASHLASQAEPVPAVIFVTAFDEFALKAFEVHALDYLLKPVRASRLADALKRASSMRPKAPALKQVLAQTAASLNSKRRHFSVQERGRVLLVPVADVLYLKAEQKYLTLHTKARDYLLEEALSAIEAEFDEIFVRVHRNSLVARSAIIGVERGIHSEGEGEHEKPQEVWQVIMRDVAERLPISRRQWPVIKALVR